MHLLLVLRHLPTTAQAAHATAFCCVRVTLFRLLAPSVGRQLPWDFRRVTGGVPEHSSLAALGIVRGKRDVDRK